jgi:hypothetical protein
MRLPALSEAQRTARDFIRDRRGAAAELIEHARVALPDMKYQARVQRDRLLSAGDIGQLETVLAQAERTLAACEEAMPALQAFEDRFTLPAAFERLKGQFVAEGEDANALYWGDNYERMTWLADRVLLFSRHLAETLIPWLRTALDEIDQSMVDRARQEDEAPARIAEARGTLASMQAAHPRLAFRHSEGLLAEAEQFLKRMVEARAQNHHRGVAENAAQAIAYAEGALTMAREALAFAEDPEGMYAAARGAIDDARAALEAAGQPLPPSLRRAGELLEQARTSACAPEPDWPAALLLYNRASAAFADVTADDL